jgi:stage II sporulation protein D
MTVMKRVALLGVLLSAAVAFLSSQAFDGGQPVIRVGFERPDGSHAVQNIPLETYVARVLVGEAAPQSPPAALEALAIAIRTYAVVNRNRHNADGFDVCDTTHCQVVRIASTATERAANATAGLVLARNGVPATVYYSASCGGYTEVPSAVWPGEKDPPYLPSQPDDACEGAPVWSSNIGVLELTRAFKAAGLRGERLREMSVVSRDMSGRVSKLHLDGFTPDQISGQDLRMMVARTLGPLVVKSAAFEMSRRRDAGRDVYHFEGRGYGHGVGMCVIGSVNLAVRGQTAAQILSRYYPGLDLVSFGGASVVAPVVAAPVGRAPAVAVASPPSGIDLSIPESTDSDRAALESLAARARDDIANELSVAPPPRLVIRVHPSAESFEHTTGLPGFTSGAVVRGEVHLLPAAALRDRGVLDRTIRRQLVHLMIDEPLADRPAWVREGAALYFSGGRSEAGEGESSSPQPRLSCPDDVELLQPVSVGAMSNAHARALACFARQVRNGRSWKDVK